MENYYKRWFFILTLPALVLFTFVIIIPFFTGILYSLTAWRGTYFAGNKSLFESFVGLQNYIKAFQSKKFTDSLIYTFQVTLVTVPATTVTALILAVLVNKLNKGKGFFRTIFYLPNMLGCLAMGYVWVFIYQVVFTDILFGPDTSVLEMELTWLMQKQDIMFLKLSLCILITSTRQERNIL